MHMPNLANFYPFVGNKLLTKNGHNSIKITGNNPKLDFVNMNAYMKFGEILSIGSQDIEQKRNSDVNQGP